MRTLSRVVGILPLLALSAASQAQVDFGPYKYEKRATRLLTEQRMIDVIQNRPEMEWGPWYLLSPFPGDEAGMLANDFGPEVQIPRMIAGGPGPNLQTSYDGKNGVKAAWLDIGHAEDRAMNLNVHDDEELNNFATCYLYRTVTVAQAVQLPVTMGSDDGLRFWLNGELLIDEDVPRGLDPEAHALTLHFQPGVNHILAKIGQGQGGWNYQINISKPIDPVMDAKLQYQLNLDFPDRESEYYAVSTIPIPEDIVLEVGGLDVMPDGRAVVCTRRGDVWLIAGADGPDPFDVKFTRFASGLHEPLGVAVRQERGQTAVYCVQRGELTRLVDSNGDDQADIYETFSDDWGVSGNYHEFAFGPKFDREGNAWVTLNVGFCGSLGKSIAAWRGWALKVNPAGEMTPVCDGLRSPNGIGEWSDGAMFYLDNQGDYVGTNRMMLLAPGLWAGHPSSLHWRDGWQPGDPEPERQRATIWFPYKKLGQSAADFLLAPPADAPNGAAFGPFASQAFVGDQTLATVMRVSLEVVDGFYQGAAFPFREGLDCGVNRLCWDKSGQMLIGQTDRGWGSIGRKRYGVQRLVWTGKMPFEVLDMNAAPDGFVLTFTEDVDPVAAADPGSYRMSSYTYKYHAPYGSPEVDSAPQKVVSATVLGPRAVHLVIDTLRAGGEGYVHELALPGVRNAKGEPLVHDQAYYTMQKIPTAMPDLSPRIR
jgi:hypothetical protein